MGNQNSLTSQFYYTPTIVQNQSMIVNQTIIAKLLSIRLKRYDYFPGEFVEGNIILQNQTQLILNDIFLYLNLSQGWSVVNETPMSELNSPIITCIKIGVAKILKIMSNPGLINLNPGMFDFPFKFKIPDNLQPSFEYPLDSQRGYLRYFLKAQINSQYAKGETNLYLFIKARPRLFKYPLIYSSAPNVQKWGMINQGSTILKVSYQAYNYQIGDKIPFLVEIDNSGGKAQVKTVDVKLVRRVQYKRLQETAFRFNFESIICSKTFAVNVPKNTVSQKFNYIMEVTDSTLNKFSYLGATNPYPSLVNLFQVMPSTFSPVIRCEYFLLITLQFNSFVTKNNLPKVCLPIVLNHQSEQDFNLENKEDEDLKKAIEASLLDMKEKNDNKDLDIKDDTNDKNGEEILFEKPKEDGDQIQNNEINTINIKDNNDNNLGNNNLENNSKSDNQNNINIINNEIKEENNNNNINNININEIREENNNNNINNININEIKEENNDNNNNNNITKDEMKKENNINNINNKKDDDEEIFNPYLLSSQNNNLPNNFSINDNDDEE